VPSDAFRDADPGDVLNLAARLADGRPLPPGCASTEEPSLHGAAAVGFVEEITVTVVASDVDGLEATSSFRLRAVVARGG